MLEDIYMRKSFGYEIDANKYKSCCGVPNGWIEYGIYLRTMRYYLIYVPQLSDGKFQEEMSNACKMREYFEIQYVNFLATISAKKRNYFMNACAKSLMLFAIERNHTISHNTIVTFANAPKPNMIGDIKKLDVNSHVYIGNNTRPLQRATFSPICEYVNAGDMVYLKLHKEFIFDFEAIIFANTILGLICDYRGEPYREELMKNDIVMSVARFETFIKDIFAVIGIKDAIETVIMQHNHIFAVHEFEPIQANSWDSLGYINDIKTHIQCASQLCGIKPIRYRAGGCDSAQCQKFKYCSIDCMNEDRFMRRQILKKCDACRKRKRA